MTKLLPLPFATTFCAGAMALGSAGTAVAQASSDWTFQLTPYLWMAAIDGTITPVEGGPSFESSLSFSELLEILEAGAFVTASARRDRFVVLGDLNYVSVSDSTGAPASAAPVDRIEAEAEVWSGTLAAGWRSVDTPRGWVDVLAGLRAGSTEMEVDAKVSGSTVERAEADISYAAPIVGVRGRVALADNVSLSGYADLGGGTANVDSTWQVFASINFALTERVSLSAGYRHQALDLDEDGAEFDTDLSGPLIGATFRF